MSARRRSLRVPSPATRKIAAVNVSAIATRDCRMSTCRNLLTLALIMDASARVIAPDAALCSASMDPVGRRAAFALLSLAAIWGLALPWLACARESSSPLLALTGRAAFALGHVICHQRPERSFFSCGVQWPVCGRCSGLYLGAAAGAVLALAIGWRAQGRRTTTPDSAARWRRILVVAALPTIVLWTIEF